MEILKTYQLIFDTNDNLDNQRRRLFQHKIVPDCGYINKKNTMVAKPFFLNQLHSINST